MAEEIDLGKLSERQLEEIVGWLSGNYDDIVAACEDKMLPKPPPV